MTAAKTMISLALLGGIPADTPDPVYVSCPGGYIAPSLADCPTVPVHRPAPTPGGGPGPHGGLLGGLLGHLL